MEAEFLIDAGEAEDFRKAISIVKNSYPLEFIEHKAGNKTYFKLNSTDALTFYKVGFAFGTMKEFRSRSARISDINI